MYKRPCCTKLAPHSKQADWGTANQGRWYWIRCRDRLSVKNWHRSNWQGCRERAWRPADEGTGAGVEEPPDAAESSLTRDIGPGTRSPPDRTRLADVRWGLWGDRAGSGRCKGRSSEDRGAEETVPETTEVERSFWEGEGEATTGAWDVVDPETTISSTEETPGGTGKEASSAGGREATAADTGIAGTAGTVCGTEESEGESIITEGAMEEAEETVVEKSVTTEETTDGAEGRSWDGSVTTEEATKGASGRTWDESVTTEWCSAEADKKQIICVRTRRSWEIWRHHWVINPPRINSLRYYGRWLHTETWGRHLWYHSGLHSSGRGTGNYYRNKLYLIVLTLGRWGHAPHHGVLPRPLITTTKKKNSKTNLTYTQAEAHAKNIKRPI